MLFDLYLEVSMCKLSFGHLYFIEQAAGSRAVDSPSSA
jgi:hypothetical protein